MGTGLVNRYTYLGHQHTLTHSVEPIIYEGNDVDFSVNVRVQPSNVTHNRETTVGVLHTVLEERGRHSAYQCLMKIVSNWNNECAAM